MTSHAPDPQEAVEGRKAREDVQRALLALSSAQREATTLYYIGGYSQREVAAFLDLPVSTVKNRLYAAASRTTPWSRRSGEPSSASNKPALCGGL